MSLLSLINPISSILGVGKDIIDDLVTTDEERAVIARKGDSEQNAINVEQAKHPSLFVAGARPAAIWMCVLGMGYETLLRPIFSPFTDKYLGAPLLPVDIATLEVLLYALLGLGGFRAVEKVRKVARDNLRPQ